MVTSQHVFSDVQMMVRLPPRPRSGVYRQGDGNEVMLILIPSWRRTTAFSYG